MTRPAEQLSDAELIEAFVNEKSQDAFAQIVSRHGSAVYGLARRQLGDQSLADDVTQAVFILLMRKAKSMRHPELLAGWLMKATRYCVLNVRRSQQRRAEHERRAACLADVAPGESGSAVLAADTLTLIDEAIARLGSVDRAIVTLSVLESRSQTEIGSILRISADAVRKRLPRAIDKIRRDLSRQGIAVSAQSLAGAFVPLAPPEGLLARIHAAHANAGSVGHSIATTVSRQMAIKTTSVATAIAATAAVVLFGAGTTAYYAFPRFASVTPAPTPVAYTDGQPGNVYSSPANPAAGWSMTPTGITPKTRQPFLGPFGNQNVSLSLANLPKHDYVRVQADLYIMDTWDGASTLEANLGKSGPDFWTMRLDDRPALVRSTFSALPDTRDFAFSSKLQTFPAVIPSDPHPAGTGAYMVNGLGFVHTFFGSLSFPMDGAYHLDFTLPHSADTLTLTVGGDGLSDIRDESWGITGVRIDAVTAAEVAKPSGDQLQKAWTAAIGLDPVASRDAFWQLVAGGDATVDFLLQQNIAAPFNSADVKSRLALIDDDDAETAFNARQDLAAMGPAIETLIAAPGSKADDNPSLHLLFELIDLRPITTPAARAAAGKAKLLAAINTPAARTALRDWLDAGKPWQPDPQRKFESAYHLPAHTNAMYVGKIDPTLRGQYLKHRQAIVETEHFKDSYIKDPASWNGTAMVYILADETPNLWTPAFPIYNHRPAGSAVDAPIQQLLGYVHRIDPKNWEPVQIDNPLLKIDLPGDWVLRSNALSQAAQLNDIAAALSKATGRIVQAEPIQIAKNDIILTGTPQIPAESAVDLYVDDRDLSAQPPMSFQAVVSTVPSLLSRYGRKVSWENPPAPNNSGRVLLRFHPGALRVISPDDSNSPENAEIIDSILTHLTAQLKINYTQKGKPITGYRLKFAT